MLVFDRTKNEFLFEGDFEDYRNEVLRDCFNELDTGTKCIGFSELNFNKVIKSILIEYFFSSNFSQLKLYYNNLKIYINYIISAFNCQKQLFLPFAYFY